MIIDLLIKTAQDSFRAGYGKPLTKQMQKVLTTYANLKRKNPYHQFKIIYCKDAKRWTVQCLFSDGWLCLHDLNKRGI